MRQKMTGKVFFNWIRFLYKSFKYIFKNWHFFNTLNSVILQDPHSARASYSPLGQSGTPLHCFQLSIHLPLWAHVKYPDLHPKKQIFKKNQKVHYSTHEKNDEIVIQITNNRPDQYTFKLTNGMILWHDFF